MMKIWFGGSIELKLPDIPDLQHDRRGKSNGCCDRVHAIETLNRSRIAGLFSLGDVALLTQEAPNPQFWGLRRFGSAGGEKMISIVVGLTLIGIKVSPTSVIGKFFSSYPF